MTEADLDRIEAALSVKLPAAYRHLLTHFPIRFDRGNADGPVWDNADKLIERNRELRSQRRHLGIAYEPTPPQYIFIGDDRSGWQNLIDIGGDPPVVSVMEFEDVKTVRPHQDDSGQPRFLNEWFHSYLVELSKDGVDINAATRPEDKMGWGCILGGLGFCLVAALVFALLLAGIQALFGTSRPAVQPNAAMDRAGKTVPFVRDVVVCPPGH